MRHVKEKKTQQWNCRRDATMNQKEKAETFNEFKQVSSDLRCILSLFLFRANDRFRRIVRHSLSYFFPLLDKRETQ